MKRAQRGFTLIELIIATVIIGILTAIAVPNYTAYIQRSNRGEARGQLLEAATWMERFRTQNGSYATAALPATLQQSPPTGTPKYTITLPAGELTATTYRIDAAPVGVMAGDICGDLRIDHLGSRAFTGGGATMDVCWNR